MPPTSSRLTLGLLLCGALLAGCKGPGANVARANLELPSREELTRTPGAPMDARRGGTVEGRVSLNDPTADRTEAHKNSDAAGRVLSLVGYQLAHGTPIGGAPGDPLPVLAQTKVGADLGWRLTLPALRGEQLQRLPETPNLQGTGCTLGADEVSDPGAYMATVYFALDTGHPEPVKDLPRAPQGAEYLHEFTYTFIEGNALPPGVRASTRAVGHALRYVDRDLKTRYRLTCTEGTQVQSTDEQLDLKAGWNLLETRSLMELRGDQKTVQRTVRVVPLSTPVRLWGLH